MRRSAGAPVLLLALGAAFACARQRPPAPEGPLNVILVVMDTTRADHLGTYGWSRPTTPSLDAFARDGVVFEDVLSPAATTSPSIASMMTGVLPSRHGVRAIESVAPGRIADRYPTVAEVLRGRGFSTAAFVASVTASSRYGFNRGFDRYEESVALARGQATAAEVNAPLFEWLRQRPRAGRFFAFVHYFDVHDLEVRPEKRFLNAFVQPGMGEVEHRIAQYDGELLYLDSQIGEMLKVLDELQHREDTVVVVLADHGEGLGQHDQMAHGLLYQEQIHVPFLVRGPGMRQGARVPVRLSALDLAPTLLDLAGVPAEQRPRDHMGRSLRPWLFTDRGPADELVVAESHNVLLRRPAPASIRGEVYAALRGPWKYVHYPRGPRSELYRLDQDPQELQDKASAEPAIVGSLHDVLVRLNVMRPLDGPRPGETVSPERMEQLKTLGYVE